jgi:hypothetical protein
VLRTPGILENVPERSAKPNCFRTFKLIISFSWASSQNVSEQVAKRNLVPPLRALQSARASSADFALRAELRLALRCAQAYKKYI